MIKWKNYALEVKRYRTEARMAKSYVKPDLTIYFSSLQSSSALQTKLNKEEKFSSYVFSKERAHTK